MSPDFLYCSDCRVLEEIENAESVEYILRLHGVAHLVEKISFAGHPDQAQFMVKSGASLGKLEIVGVEKTPV